MRPDRATPDIAPQGFDNIRLFTVDEPPSWGLLLFGFGAIAWQRRRTRSLRLT